MAYDLVSPKYELTEFIAEHSNEPEYQRVMKHLLKSYRFVRRTCADGSCFYRGLGFAFLESLLEKPQDVPRFKERVQESEKLLISAGIPEDGYRTHYKIFLSLVGSVEKDGSVMDLAKAFNYLLLSDSAVRYLRLVTSAFLRSKAEFYAPFIDEQKCMEEFCEENVEPLTAVCDHVQITALTQALDIPILIEYMTADKVLNQHIFPEGSDPCVYMLYKQDHYSLLYKK